MRGWPVVAFSLLGCTPEPAASPVEVVPVASSVSSGAPPLRAEPPAEPSSSWVNRIAAGNPHAAFAKLERGPCLFNCPIYTLTVHADGSVDYEGSNFVKTAGRATWNIGQKGVADLVRAFEEARFFQLADAYVEVSVTCAPYNVTNLSVGGRTKTIRHYAGDMHAPDALVALEEAFDRIVNSEPFVGTREEQVEH